MSSNENNTDVRQNETSAPMDEDNIPVQSFKEMLAFTDEPEKTEKQVYRDASGMPISAEEAARQAAALDALDRDLAKARNKKIEEERFQEHIRQVEKEKEKERLARAEEMQQRHDVAMENLKMREKAKAERDAAGVGRTKQEVDLMQSAKDAVKKQRTFNRHFNKTLFSIKAGKAFVVILVLAAIAYAAAYFYVDTKTDYFYIDLASMLTNRDHYVEINDYEYQMPASSPYTYEAKGLSGLNPWLPDTDRDGLSDYYESTVSKTKPDNPDGDSDGVYDGRELRAGLDPTLPMTDGITPDGQVMRDTTASSGNVTAEIKSIPKTAFISLSKSDNNSIQGIPGIIGNACEFYTDKTFDSCDLIFTYTAAQIAAKSADESSLSVYRFDPDSLSFEQVASSISTERKQVTARINEIGIYALCDSNVAAKQGNTNIFFLIDNSGSMYPESLCPNSEENDVEFKRLEFSATLIDMIGSDANYGAAQFLGTYTGIAPISSDSEGVKKKIYGMKNNIPPFSGTDIAGSLMSAVNEFGTVTPGDRNYIILLTDGMPTNPDPALEQQAVDLAKANGITVFTIGLGKKIDSEYLYNIAQQTNGQFFQASNADALENIYSKIQSFMSYNQVTLDEESGRKGYVIADSGFNVLKDGIGYNNFRTDFASDGAAPGIAGLIRAYYTGELKMRESSYVNAAGETVPGYDISALELFVDGKTDLRGIDMDVLNAYSEYLLMPDKWDYRRIRNDTLQFNEKTRDYIDAHNLEVMISDYHFMPAKESKLMKFLRMITFKPLNGFSDYECVLINSSACKGNDLELINMIRWYYYLPQTDKCQAYDFGYDGDETVEMLINELNTGHPAVIDFGGAYMNAVRFVRDANDPNKFVIDAYDSNTPGRVTRLDVKRTPIYDGETTPHYQYIVSRGDIEQPTKLIVIK